MDRSETVHPNDRLRQERIGRNWRQQDLADQLGTTVVTVRRWERGSQQPSAYFRIKLCALFGKSAEELGLVREGLLQQEEAERKSSTSIEDVMSSSPIHISSLWGVPFLRNPFFTGRKEVLQQVHDALSHQHAAVLSQSYTVSGLGGIGKTQIALEYTYRFADEYSGVFWISAETYESIMSSLVATADLLNLPESQQQDQEKISRAVIRWLINHKDWLLVLDNVENLALVKPFLPPARSGSLLFTSRQLSLGLTARTLDLERMTPEEGMRFLLHRSRLLDPTSSFDQLAPSHLTIAREIVVELDGLPLALDQAGSYIEATHCSLAEYRQLFHSARLRLLNERDAHADHPLSVARTFALAFEHLEQNNSFAADLLTICVFLAPEAIPEALFIEGAAHLGPPFEALSTDPFVFHTALKALLTYSLLQRNATTKTVTIHRLVQAILKGHLSETTRRLWLTRVTHTLCQLFPFDEKTQTNYWQMCEQLLPHALMCFTHNEQKGENDTSHFILMSHVAAYLTRRAHFDEAKVLYERALQLGERMFDSEHSLVAEALHGLGILCKQQGQYEQAKMLYERALRIREHVLGPDHPHVAVSLNNLAILYKEQGQYEQAKMLHERALHIREHVLGPNHPHVAVSLNNLAGVYIEQGRYEQAELLYLRSLRLWEQALGPDHLEVACLLNNLAQTYSEQGRYEEAESLNLRALRIWEQALGSDHPLIAEACNNLAENYTAQGRYEEAESLSLRALHIWEQALGSDHPYVAFSLNGLANIYQGQGKYEQAILLYLRALTLRQQQRGSQHLETAETLHDLARFYHIQQQNVEALSLYQQALMIREQVLGEESPKTCATRAAYTHLLKEMGRLEEANVVEDQAESGPRGPRIVSN